jgi:hypothetical protein
MIQTDVLDSAILQELNRLNTCTFQELSERLPSYSWNEIYSEVDRLNREGTIALKHPAPFLLILSLATTNQAPPSEGNFSSGPEAPTTPGVYWFLGQATSNAVRVEVRLKEGTPTVWWANQDHPVTNLTGIWYGPMSPLSGPGNR